MTADLMPEPPDRAIVMAGRESEEAAYIRDDTGLDVGDAHRWWQLEGTTPVNSYRWREVAARGHVVRLYRQAELDQAVAEAGLTVVGAHIVERGGYCRTCMSHHSTVEIARLEDRLAEEDQDGR